jgi:hypothetical protein
MSQLTSADRRTSRQRILPGRRSLPLLLGALIAAASLVFGGIATASAQHDQGRNNPTPAPGAAPPRHGDTIPNVTTVESLIKAYYGTVAGSVPGIGPVTLPSPAGNYADEVRGIEADAKSFLSHAVSERHPGTRPAVVFDIDDTTLNTFDYEIFSTFAFNPATNAQFVFAKAFPAVFGMPDLVNWAGSHGYTVFFITGRPEAQREPTVGNLTDVGYAVPTDVTHVFLKQPTPPPYLTCVAAPTCTTIEYKSGTRTHIESEGFHIVADFGDQFSDLNGGFAGHQVKLPNPMYFLP